MARVERRPTQVMTAFAFRSRFTDSERAAARVAATTDDLAADLREAMLAAQEVSLDPTTPEGALTRNGIGYYELIGVLTPERRDAILGAQ